MRVIYGRLSVVDLCNFDTGSEWDRRGALTTCNMNPLLSELTRAVNSDGALVARLEDDSLENERQVRRAVRLVG